MFANNNPANYDNLIPILSLSAALCIGPLRIVGYEAYLPKNLGTPHHPTIIQYPSKNLTHIVSVVHYPQVRHSQS